MENSERKTSEKIFSEVSKTSENCEFSKLEELGKKWSTNCLQPQIWKTHPQCRPRVKELQTPIVLNTFV